MADAKSGSTLAVLLDGAPLPPDEARALWERFSAWMEEHRGDLAGFAAAEGFASVHPGIAGGRPVLQVSRSAPQRPYASTPVDAGRSSGQGPAQPLGRTGGSGNRHKPMAVDRPARRKHKK